MKGGLDDESVDRVCTLGESSPFLAKYNHVLLDYLYNAGNLNPLLPVPCTPELL